MRAFSKIAATTVLAGGLTVFGVGAAFADPPQDVTEPVDGVAETTEDVAADVTDPVEGLSPEAEALLQDPQVQEILADEDAVALLSDPDALEALQALLELEDPVGALEALDLPVGTDDLPVDGVDDVTGDVPVEDVTQPVDDLTGGVGLP
ncbi:hypothetical protein [Nocardiopsis sp. MG754419]|uniref:hypothetical protein n=1 Tax=Nocardiopsis sp. MG754419 TaxID=2259865 RepID=UPI001BAE4B02|nr:hypothetical protein [Nocardiopsis sp. MG754419]MBR8744067.1 hypothetical protein [Nocardiopsis sp. MG754419]